MRKTIFGLVLSAAASGVFAADNGAGNTGDQGAAAIRLLAGIQNELTAMHAELAARNAPADGCKYEDKDYTEGAVRQVGNIALVCTERAWGIHVSGEPRTLVWEPITSKRIAPYLKATGLGMQKE